MRTQSVMQKKMSKVQKKLDYYESQKESDWLNINDFRRI